MCLYVDNRLLWGRTLSHCRPQTGLLLQMIHFIQGTFSFLSSSLPDLNYVPPVLFCDVIFGVSVAMAVMWVSLEHARTTESTFHVIVKTFQSLYQALLQELHSPPTS